MFLTVVPAANVAEFETMRVAIDDAEVVLAAREAEFRAIFETASAGVAETDTRTVRFIRVNHCFCEIVGRTEEELVGRLGPDDIAHPEDRRGIAVGNASRHSGTGQARGVSRIVRPDGTVIWVQYSEAPSHRDEEGHPLRVVTVVQDITDRKRAEETLALLAREVDHRAKNALAVIQTALRLSPREDLGTYAAAVEGRVGALARAQTLLANENWSGVSLRELVQGELAPFTSGQSVNLSGPHIVLAADMAQPLGMTIHELATNALKHGALSVAEGSVSISWRPVDGASDRFHLSWVEAGGPPVAHPPKRRGFGSRVIEGTLRRQLSGAVSFSWKTSGLVCEMTVPLRNGLSIAASADDPAIS
jgi:PAS domain S-box-containing protein